MVDGRLLFAQVNNCPDLDWKERKLNADQEPPNYVEKDDWNSKLHSFIHIKLSLCSLFLIILNIWLYKYCVWNSLSAWGNGTVLWIALPDNGDKLIVGTAFLWEDAVTTQISTALYIFIHKSVPCVMLITCHIATCNSHMTVYSVLCSMSWSTSIAPCNCADTIRRHCPRSPRVGWLTIRVSLHSSNLTPFQSYTILMLHYSNFTPFQSHIIPILHSLTL